MCITESAQGAVKLIFVVEVALDGNVQKCQTGVFVLDLEKCGQSAEVMKFQLAVS